ncbi:PREDICTED: uncharacterized protein LOC104593635 [Nelumbo nucifera]|uniref:Uncharacterized protein LOC104593635 n=2 Tax=Nelumbo nucifera TaxID=4432 RepID=A0A1U7ZJW0_NELNU|nr:PREDICTED: uncharacterized protein LOC104593635 [Nelumbo nucifera]DAD43005.1 TPA_asm: hypothetical protein HUJ06_001235 [Nelumbo nucifera]
MGNRVSTVGLLRMPWLVETCKQVKILDDLKQNAGDRFPSSDYHPPDRMNWMSGLNSQRIHINKIVWPGTHDSATNQIGIPIITRPFAECQSLSIYDQLVWGVRALDIRVQHERKVCHGPIASYSIDVVIRDVKSFLSETQSEIIILEIRTEYGCQDPPEFDEYLVDQLGELLIHQDERVFGKTVAELLPRRVICVWKPRQQSAPPKAAGQPLWSAHSLRDDWVDTDLPLTKFESNLQRLSEQPPASSRKFFYRVENTLTPQTANMSVIVEPLARTMHRYARLFIAQCFSRGFADRLQIFSTDFVEEDFVDACIGFTQARIEGKA